MHVVRFHEQVWLNTWKRSYSRRDMCVQKHQMRTGRRAKVTPKCKQDGPKYVLSRKEGERGLFGRLCRPRTRIWKCFTFRGQLQPSSWSWNWREGLTYKIGRKKQIVVKNDNRDQGIWLGKGGDQPEICSGILGYLISSGIERRTQYLGKQFSSSKTITRKLKQITWPSKLLDQK